MYPPDSLRLHVEPYKLFAIEGVRIAVLGLIHQGENGIPEAHPDNVKNIRFRSPLEGGIQYGWLRYVSDVFILLSHDEHEDSVRLVNQYPFADVLIGGHTHFRVDGTEIHNNVLVTEAESHLKYVTHITLHITDGKVTGKEARLLDINAFSRKDEEVQAMVDDFNNNESLARVVTQALTDFDNKEELGCMMADAIRVEAGADIGFQNPGGVRLATFPKGPITVKYVFRLDPFGNAVILFNLTGAEILRLIEAAYIADKGAAFVSGITYEMELDKQGRVKNLQVKMADGSRLNLQRTYKVVFNDYLAAICKYEKSDEGQSLFRASADITIDYLEKQPAVDYKGVKRITVKN
jgi:2',3'-cyclic-nucleotide 2'-phosphodiesterase (5'-nucleotidase family)